MFLFPAQLLFIMNAVNQGSKREREEMGWKAILNQGECRSFLETCLVWLLGMVEERMIEEINRRLVVSCTGSGPYY